jgi:6-phosphogluconolactonase
VEDYELEANRYEVILPNNIDILLLSIGEDAHVASLFPGDFSSQNSNSKVVVVTGPKPPNPRISITPKLIAQAKQIFCLVSGSSKSDALFKVFQDTGDPLSFPAKLVQYGHWLVDRSAAKMIEIS